MTQTQPNQTSQPSQVSLPEQKPKWKQFTFWLPILTPLLNFVVVMIAVKYPTVADALKRSGLQDSIWTLVGGSSVTSAAYIIGEKHRDGIITSALVQAQNPVSAVVAPVLPVQTGALSAVASAVDSVTNSSILDSIVDDPNETVHYRNTESAG